LGGEGGEVGGGGGVYYWRQCFASKMGEGLINIASEWGLISGGLFANKIWGAYRQEGLFLVGLIIRILRYYIVSYDIIMLL